MYPETCGTLPWGPGTSGWRMGPGFIWGCTLKKHDFLVIFAIFWLFWPPGTVPAVS